MGSIKGILLFLVLVFEVCVFVCVLGCESARKSLPSEPAFVEVQRDQEAKRLFQLCAVAEGRDVQTRMKAAEALAKTPGAEMWILLILYDEWALYYPGVPLPEKKLEGFAMFDRAVIATLLKNLPTQSSQPVLFAATRFLSETEGGQYPWFRGLKIGNLEVWGKMGTGWTEPLRDIARNFLVRALGVDHSYSEEAWRKEILERDMGGN